MMNGSSCTNEQVASLTEAVGAAEHLVRVMHQAHDLFVAHPRTGMKQPVVDVVWMTYDEAMSIEKRLRVLRLAALQLMDSSEKGDER